MKKTFSILTLCALPATVLAHGMHDEDTAFGMPGEAARVNRTVEVEASDNMRFTPDVITVKRGETIEFVVKNTGKLAHEFVLGDAKELAEHAALMRRYPDMEHDDPNELRMAPGSTGKLIWKFAHPGTVGFACLIPGHYEAGMKGQIHVLAK
jgi:uncharacterized cupredoxin-like copper-binding protein